ncbi:MAG: hypothetical protein A4E57_01326 [Syntrophorhabdaceae bacterium PtaU1.Bin034]|nr:MAG: hypothetical protein A4E57_01326 [Syntrophorhabdaceae bacterium PtaU1.Bin034]
MQIRRINSRVVIHLRSPRSYSDKEPGSGVSELLQQVLVEHRWEFQDSTKDINTSIIELRREVQLALMEIKGKMTIYLVIFPLAMVVLARVLVLALR